MPGRRSAKISKDELVELQKKLRTDSAIGEALGVRLATVQRWRKKWGIPALGKRGKPRIANFPKAQLVELQGKLGTDSAIARSLGVCTSVVYKWRKKWGIPALGRGGWPQTAVVPKEKLIELQQELKTDDAIGAALGISAKTVQCRRTKFGIPALGKLGKPRISNIPKDRLLELQAEYRTDTAIARALGLSPWTVWRWRKKWGIPALSR